MNVLVEFLAAVIDDATKVSPLVLAMFSIIAGLVSALAWWDRRFDKRIDAKLIPVMHDLETIKRRQTRLARVQGIDTRHAEEWDDDE